MADSPQRAYRAACPNCGAPVEFASAASASAVCGFCRSTLLRDGDALTRIGQQAELFDDHSPLQLHATGRWQGETFTLVGRLQYAYGDASQGGRWTEWNALFDNGKRAWLSEDNGRHVLAFDQPSPPDAPAEADLRPGATLQLAGQAWQVASVQRAQLHAAQGELPGVPRPAGRAFTVADLRNPRDEVATLDYGSTPPLWSVGRAVRLAELALSGLRQGSEKTLGGRSLACPNCGAAVEVKLASSQAVVCGQCQTVVQLDTATGAALDHYRQDQARPPLIPLGRVGRLALGDGAAVLPWQVVGYVERCELAEDPGDEQVFWREYLLFNETEGFAFLVDADEGWSWVLPLTGAPEVRGAVASHGGRRYERRYSYASQVTHVLGEFYWRVQRDQRARHTDYASGDRRLNREESDGEVTWSAGQTLDAAALLKAFGLDRATAGAPARDSAPLAGSGAGLGKVVFILVVMLLVVILMSRCGDDDCDGVRQAFGPASAEYAQCQRNQRSGSGFRSSGGSWGGFSTGGGHK